MKKQYSVLIQDKATGHISIEIITAETRSAAMQIAETLHKGTARDAVEAIQEVAKNENSIIFQSIDGSDFCSQGFWYYTENKSVSWLYRLGSLL